MDRKYMAAVLTGFILAGSVSAASPITAGAFDLWGVLDTTVSGISAYAELDKQIDYLDNTEEGRQQLFTDMKKSNGVADDPEHMWQLDRLMKRESDGIATTDPSINDKPFLYFISQNQSFNASCTMGHVMQVNQGLYKYLTNEDEIAVVLGHEMGHGMKNHVANAIKKKVKTEIGAGILAGSISGSALTNVLINLGVNQLETVTITRGDEWEADNLSFDYTYHAGYNPGASAAVWQRMIDIAGDNDPNFAQEVFAPSDHPSNSDRRDNYMKKLTKLSGDHVSLKKDTDTVLVNKKEFVNPAPAGDMSSAERKYFVIGNLAAAYDHKENKKPASARDGTVYLGDQAVMTPVSGDPSAEELAELLNKIK